MSLCPDFCHCRTCSHGAKSCEVCLVCITEDERRKKQKTHEESVKRQQAKLKICPWVTDPDPK